MVDGCLVISLAELSARSGIIMLGRTSEVGFRCQASMLVQAKRRDEENSEPDCARGLTKKSGIGRSWRRLALKKAIIGPGPQYYLILCILSSPTGRNSQEEKCMSKELRSPRSLVLCHCPYSRPRLALHRNKEHQHFASAHSCILQPLQTFWPLNDARCSIQESLSRQRGQTTVQAIIEQRVSLDVESSDKSNCDLHKSGRLFI